MDPGPYRDRILDDESLAGDLDEADAAALVKALVAKAETAALAAKTEAAADAAVDQLRKAGRGIGKTVAAWRDDGPEAAAGLAKKAGLHAPPADADSTSAVLAFYLEQLGK